MNFKEFTKSMTKEEAEEFMKPKENNLEIDERKVKFTKKSIERIAKMLLNKK